MKDFHKSLNNIHVTEDEYEYAHNVWKTFNIKNVGESMSYMLNQTHYYLLMSLKALEKHLKKNII